MKNVITDELPEVEEQPNEPGLYSFDGKRFVKLEPSEERKVPVTDEAYDATRAARKRCHDAFGFRPDLSVVVSAMLLFAVKADPIQMDTEIRLYGQKLYSLKFGGSA
jgi:hypothetical protein